MGAGASKILTVSYGTFSCTLEGFDEPFVMMKAIAEHFRELAAEDRYFGAEPPQPDGEALQRLASRETRARVEARVDAAGLTLRATPPEPVAENAPPAQINQEVAAKLDRIRRAMAEARAPVTSGDRWPGMSVSVPPEAAFPLPDAEPAETPDSAWPMEDVLPLLGETPLPTQDVVHEADSGDVPEEIVLATAVDRPVAEDVAPMAPAITEAREEPWEDRPGDENLMPQNAIAEDMAAAAASIDGMPLPGEALEGPAIVQDLPFRANLPDEAEPLTAFRSTEENPPQNDTVSTVEPLPEPAAWAATPTAEPREDNLRRMFDATGEHLIGNDSEPRISAVAQLRAALAATIAEHIGRRKTPEPEAAPEARPAPLVLVTAQRIDPEVPEALPDGIIHPQPIRLARTEAQFSRAFDGSGPPCESATAQSFARFARSHGSHGLDDLLEAAAAYTAQVEGHSHFAPPDIMHKLSAISDEGEFTPEERLRVFGRLLRQGKIAKIRPGQYTIAEASRFYQKRA